MAFWPQLPKPWVTFAAPDCTQVQPHQWINISRAGSCLHFSHECLQRIIIAVRVCRFGMELLPSGGILCGNVGQFHIAGIFLFILKVSEKKWTTAQSAHSLQHCAVSHGFWLSQGTYTDNKSQYGHKRRCWDLFIYNYSCYKFKVMAGQIDNMKCSLSPSFL